MNSKNLYGGSLDKYGHTCSTPFPFDTLPVEVQNQLYIVGFEITIDKKKPILNLVKIEMIRILNASSMN